MITLTLHNYLLFPQCQDNELDIDGHGTTKMIPVYLADSHKLRLPGYMVFMGKT